MRQPGGPSSVRLKSNVPFTWAHADNVGLILEPHKRLRVISACGSSRSHKCRGKSLSALHSPAMKWFWKVHMALSAALHRCTAGGTNWKSMFSWCINSFSCCEHSLSNRCSRGRNPARHSLECNTLYASNRLAAVRFLNGWVKMVLES